MYVTVDETYYKQLIDKAIKYDCIVQELFESKGFDITFPSEEDYQHYYNEGLDKRHAICNPEAEKIISNPLAESSFAVNPVQAWEINC